MANEITVSFRVDVANAAVTDFFTVYFQMDQTGTDVQKRTQDVGTSEEVLTLGEGTSGLIAIKNLDGTNFIEVRPNTGVADMIKIGPGEGYVFYIPSDATPYVIADTATVKIQTFVLEV